ncbi:unnamed protein product [Caenorhabditis sp. 36 PRJEB53466]|nr:unnamed protein product [Caenorhabditis sp. 36 PRJEB53466]
MANELNSSVEQLLQECSSTLHFAAFHASLLFHSLVALASFFAIFHFLEKHIKNSPIHKSFKFLIVAYFFNRCIHGVVFVTAATSFWYRFAMFSDDVTDSIAMEPGNYKYLHLIYALVQVTDVTIKMLLCPISVVYLSFRGADFDNSPGCYALFAPRNTVYWVNILFVTSLLLTILSFVLLRCLILLNSKKLKIHHFQLTTRYQIRENLTCTHLISTVLVASLAVSILYAASMLVLRTAHFQVFIDNRPLFSTVKLALYPMPLADSIIPMYSASQMDRTKSAKMCSLKNAISTATSVKKSTDAYERILRAQWA